MTIEQFVGHLKVLHAGQGFISMACDQPKEIGEEVFTEDPELTDCRWRVSGFSSREEFSAQCSGHIDPQVAGAKRPFFYRVEAMD